MSQAKFHEGQQVSFKHKGTVKTGRIIEVWFYACQGFVDAVMYDIDCGEHEKVTVDESRILIVPERQPPAIDLRYKKDIEKRKMKPRFRLGDIVYFLDENGSPIGGKVVAVYFDDVNAKCPGFEYSVKAGGPIYSCVAETDLRRCNIKNRGR